MILNATGSILDSAAEAIVIPCNCVGITGAGLALAASKRWPEETARYQWVCRSNNLSPGKMVACPEHGWDGENGFPDGRYVVWFPTKIHWKDPSRLEWIEAGLESLRADAEFIGWESISIPALGCGLGGLRWADVRPLIEAAFADYAGTVHLYAPGSERE